MNAKSFSIFRSLYVILVRLGELQLWCSSENNNLPFLQPTSFLDLEKEFSEPIKILHDRGLDRDPSLLPTYQKLLGMHRRLHGLTT